MTTRVLRAGYYWQNLRTNCSNFVKKCISYKRHDNLIHQLAKELYPIISSYPFFIWGMDILRPFPTAPGQRKFLLVVIDYFTLWVEVEPLASITTQVFQNFF